MFEDTKWANRSRSQSVTMALMGNAICKVQTLIVIFRFSNNHPAFRGVHVAQSLVFCVMVCRSLFVLFFFRQLCYCKFGNYCIHLLLRNIKNTKFVKDLPMIDAQFRFNQCNSFREEDISVFSRYDPVLILWPLQIWLEPNCTWMFIGWSSTNFTSFVLIWNSKWRLRQDLV
jgi:hypothetical protein